MYQNAMFQPCSWLKLGPTTFLMRASTLQRMLLFLSVNKVKFQIPAKMLRFKTGGTKSAVLKPHIKPQATVNKSGSSCPVRPGPLLSGTRPTSLSHMTLLTASLTRLKCKNLTGRFAGEH